MLLVRTVALFFLCTAAASAADVVLTCPITITKGTSQFSIQRRFEINFDSMSVAQYINQGSGWDSESTLTLSVADNDKYEFSGAGVAKSYIDRHTGEYYQEDGRGIARGTCHKAGGDKQVLF